VLLYYITDRMQFPGDERRRRECLLERIEEAARNGVDFIQLREKDLCARELVELAQSAVELIRVSETKARLLINSRTDIAVAVGVDGVHLRANDISPEKVRNVWREANGRNDPIIAVSCHTEADVIAAQQSGADFVAFGPIFEKKGSSDPQVATLELLRSVCRHRIPIFALGGVTTENARSAVAAGAKGVAGIRLFQKSDMKATVANLRS
jgi:thiamine-phosphate pyrophosphorylase